jgi:hypothetical protein
MFDCEHPFLLFHLIIIVNFLKVFDVTPMKIKILLL